MALIGRNGRRLNRATLARGNLGLANAINSCFIELLPCAHMVELADTLL